MAIDTDSVGILFPGQGAQTIGMGQWLHRQFPAARDLFTRAGDILGYDLAEVCFNGPDEKLSATEFSQPALFVTGIAAATVWTAQNPAEAEKIKAAAGLSLGEYTAVCFAGGLSFDDALRLVQRRGQAMQAAANAVKSGMASILGLELADVQQVCDENRGEGEVLQPANLLCPGNIAISGHLSAIDTLEKNSAGKLKLIRLNVAGAFHTTLMQSAVPLLQAALDEMPMKDCRLPIYSNVDAAPHQSASEIRDLLSRQVVNPVRWEDSIRRMIADGIGGFLEAGCGRVLRGTLKRIDRKIPNDGFGDEAAS